MVKRNITKDKHGPTNTTQKTKDCVNIDQDVILCICALWILIKRFIRGKVI